MFVIVPVTSNFALSQLAGYTFYLVTTIIRCTSKNIYKLKSQFCYRPTNQQTNRHSNFQSLVTATKNARSRPYFHPPWPRRYFNPGLLSSVEERRCPLHQPSKEEQKDIKSKGKLNEIYLSIKTFYKFMEKAFVLKFSFISIKND